MGLSGITSGEKFIHFADILILIVSMGNILDDKIFEILY